MTAAAVRHALHALRRYVIGTNHRESQAAAQLPLEAIRHAMGYVDERLDAVALD
jgi:hypothetical protein